MTRAAARRSPRATPAHSRRASSIASSTTATATRGRPALGDGTFVDSKPVALRLGFKGGYHLVHTVHVVPSHGKWTWTLPSWRFRDYRADRCPTDAGSSRAPSSA